MSEKSVDSSEHVLPPREEYFKKYPQDLAERVKQLEEALYSKEKELQEKSKLVSEHSKLVAELQMKVKMPYSPPAMQLVEVQNYAGFNFTVWWGGRVKRHASGHNIALGWGKGSCNDGYVYEGQWGIVEVYGRLCPDLYDIGKIYYPDGGVFIGLIVSSKTQKTLLRRRWGYMSQKDGTKLEGQWSWEDEYMGSNKEYLEWKSQNIKGTWLEKWMEVETREESIELAERLKGHLNVLKSSISPREFAKNPKTSAATP